MSETKANAAKAAELQAQIAELEAAQKVKELEAKLAALTRQPVSDVPTGPYVSYRMVKCRKDGTKLVETQYLRVKGCHGNAETFLQMEKRGKELIGYGNLEKLKDPDTRRSIQNYVDTRMGRNRDPLMAQASSVMDQKVERAKAERAKNA
jgi:hypothetical protein